METELVEITPPLARHWLKSNTGNRHLRRSHVETLRLAFARGEYVTTHQGIAFGKDGRLIDGQHRLAAIALLPDNFRVEMLMTTGLDGEAAFPVIDSTSVKRTNADILHINRDLAEVAYFLARTYTGMNVGLTPTFLSPYVTFIEKELTELIDYCGTRKRIWSSAPVRAAAVLKMKECDADYVKLLYAALLRNEFSLMPRIAQALFSATVSGKVNTAARTDLFVRCLKVFDPSYRDLTKVQIRSLPECVKEARELIDSLMQANSASNQHRRVLTASARARRSRSA